MIKNIILILILFTSPLFSDTLQIDKLKPLAPRNIGPAGMSGRVTAIDVHPTNKNIILVGTASGGLWKSTNGGVSWNPIFDNERVQSIGAIAIQKNNPDVIWVGTGEGNPRNSMTQGAGIYKSIDGGKSWKLMGLEKTKNIHRVIINKHNPNHITVGATGNPWAESEDRGVFTSKDGGKTWTKSLYNNNITGCADLVVDPANPNKMIASMWEHRRWPWFFNSGGIGSGLYITYDGGDNWRKINKGLPGEMGRSGISISHSSPNVVYAIVESKKNAFYRSDDGGESWRMVTNKGQFGNRPFYYAEIYVDPSNENRIYSIWSVVSMSEDGGKTWNVIMPYGGTNGVHPDHQAWWQDVDDPDYIIEGNDGGLNISRDHGNTWRFVENLPVAQFYHINIDNAEPYNVYGGMQDNGSWKGPSRAFHWGGISNAMWEEVSFGDGFDVSPDANDSRYVFTMSQEGNLYRYDVVTGESNYIKPVHPEGKDLRFHWNAALAQDPFDVNTIYYGSQYVHISKDRGENWMLMSDDLTTNDSTKQKQLESGGLTYDVTGAENHTTILCIAPSNQKKGEIWVGTDDGNIQLTTDNGESWNNLAENIKDAPEGAWVAQINPSNYNTGEAHVVMNNYRQGDFTPYLYHTNDAGKSWTNILSGKDIWGYVLSFQQDPIEKNLMFLGTEYGLYISIDGGDSWTKWTESYPNGVSTMDLKIHQREHDLVIGTFGRAAWIMDDIRPLRELAANNDVLNDSLTTMDSPTAYLASYKVPMGMRFGASGEYGGDNKSGSGIIQFFIHKPEMKKKEEKENEDSDEKKDDEPKFSRDSVNIKIMDMNGNEIRNLYRKVNEGLNRVYWNLDSKGVRSPNRPKPKNTSKFEPGGNPIMPGEYKLMIEYMGQSKESSILVKYDPRGEFKKDAFDKQMAMIRELEKKTVICTSVMDNIRDAQDVINKIKSRIDDAPEDIQDSLKTLNKNIQKDLDEVKSIFSGSTESKQGIFRRPNTLSANLGNASYYIQSSQGAPTSTSEFQMKIVEKQLAEFVEAYNKFNTEKWSAYQSEIEKIDFSIFKDFEQIKLD